MRIVIDAVLSVVSSVLLVVFAFLFTFVYISTVIVLSPLCIAAIVIEPKSVPTSLPLRFKYAIDYIAELAAKPFTP